jgi:hypothetical protein
MQRRDFLRLAGAGGAAVLAGHGSAGAAENAPVETDPSEGLIATKSRTAYRELIDLLEELDSRFLGPEGGITRPGDVADGHRRVMHDLSGGLDFFFGTEAANPFFERIVSPSRKSNGDNPDAIYFRCPVSAKHRYRVRGRTAGAAYTSFTIESGTQGGRYPTRVSSDLSDAVFDVAPDGSYELILSAEPPAGNEQNWLALAADAGSLTTRHYFEEERCAAGDPRLVVPLTIERISDPDPAPVQDDAYVAEQIRSVARYLGGRTLDGPMRDAENQPAWVSTVPNVFNPPEKPGDMAFAAVDQAYAMAPYVVRPDEALVIEGRFPPCRFANVVLWDRFLQSYDYVNRRISLNRKQTVMDPDGGFRIVLAHRDPGVPNWLDASGRVSGLIYWRFMLPEGEIVTPRTRLVKLDEVSGG